ALRRTRQPRSPRGRGCSFFRAGVRSCARELLWTRWGCQGVPELSAEAVDVAEQAAGEGGLTGEGVHAEPPVQNGRRGFQDPPGLQRRRARRLPRPRRPAGRPTPLPAERRLLVQGQRRVELGLDEEAVEERRV